MADTSKGAPARAPREPRHKAREAAVQMLYQWEVGRQPMPEVIRSFWTHAPAASASYPEALQAFASTLAAGTVEHVAELDRHLAEAAKNWRVERMNVMDRLILRLAIYELVYTPDVPPLVVIDEALELARTFSTDEAVKFINGILDAVRRTLQRV